MKTLVIHPKDKTTDFLAEIYADKNWTVINSNIASNKLIEQIKVHDRIVMLGHGSQYGLFGYNNYVINSALVHLLVEKECVCIWCNANHFVFKHGLKGFNTGMIISEMEEAMAYDICCNQEQIEMSNVLFAEAVKKSVDTNNIITNMKRIYKGDNPVIQFNVENLYSKEEGVVDGNLIFEYLGINHKQVKI